MIKKRLIYNTALLTASSLVMRCIGMAFQVWIVGRIGSSGIGLFQLVMSVGMLASTFAISGIRFAATRLISEESGYGMHGGISRAMRRCLAYSALFGVSACVILYMFAEPIGFLWVGDARTVQPLRYYSLCLPFISLSSVFSGYFTATGRVYKSAINQVSEQLLRIALVAVMLGFTQEGDIEQSCSAVVLGGVAAEIFSFLFYIFLYLTDRHMHGEKGEHSKNITSRMFKIALPLAFSAYARTSLSTLEHLLVPRGLKLSGMSADSALSGYGTIQGMVLPIIFFPSSLLLALAELLVPEMTEAQVAGRTGYIRDSASSLLSKCLIYSIGAAGIMFTFADTLALAIYSSAEAGIYIKIFSVLAPVMYLDMVTDGLLKGLGQQMYSMGVNIADALISVILVFFLLPRYSLTGYIVIICFTECFNFAMSILRLRKVAGFKINPGKLFVPLMCVIGSSQAVQLILSILGVTAAATVPTAIISVALTGVVYVLLIKLCAWEK